MKRLRRIIVLGVIASLAMTNAFAAKKQKTIKLKLLRLLIQQLVSMVTSLKSLK